MVNPHDRRLGEIEELYRRQFVRFLRVAIAITGDHERAREAVQDAFAGAIRSRHRYRGEGPLEAWLWRAVVNAARKARERPALELTPEHEPPGNGHGRGAGSELRTLVALLPERQRLAVFLRYYADLDYRSIAAALEIEVGTVSATLNAAHAALRRAIEEVPR